MPNAAFQINKDLQFRNDVLAFRFSQSVSVKEALDLLSRDLVAHVEGASNGVVPAFVVLDFRTVHKVSAVDSTKFGTLQKQLSRVNWKLILFRPDPAIREVFSARALVAHW